MDQTTTYLEFKTDLFANTFFDVIKKYHDLEVCCEGKWSYISDITIRFVDGEVMDHVSGYYLYLTEESLEKYGWYFKEDDY